MMTYRQQATQFYLRDCEESFYSNQHPEEKADMIMPTKGQYIKEIKYPYEKKNAKVISNCECSQCIQQQPTKYVRNTL